MTVMAATTALYFHGLPGTLQETTLIPSLAESDAGTLVDGWRIDAQSIKAPIAVTAFSLGAFGALRFAAEHPDKVSSLHLISPAAPLGLGDFLPQMAGGSVFKLARDRPAAFRALTNVQSAVVRLAPSLVHNTLFKNVGELEAAFVERSDVKDILRNSFARTYGPSGRPHYIEQVISYTQPWAKLIERILCPVRVTHGLDDRWTPPDMVEALSRSLGKQLESLTSLKRHGHFSTMGEA